jgi:hypothetical protein
VLQLGRTMPQAEAAAIRALADAARKLQTGDAWSIEDTLLTLHEIVVFARSHHPSCHANTPFECLHQWAWCATLSDIVMHRLNANSLVT